MSEQLKVDMDQLERIRIKLSQVTSLLYGNDTFSADAADFVGHAGLAQHVRDFGTSWNQRRVTLTTRLARIEDAVGQIGSSFETVETELKDGILGKSSTPAGASK